MKNTTITRDAILQKSFPIILKKGFQATGLVEILNAARIPKGSFYHYFPSKEIFGLELIDYFIKTQWNELYIKLRDGQEPPLSRLRNYFRESIELFQSMNFEGGCPIGNLAQEMSYSSPVFREKLDKIYNMIIKIFQKTLDEAVACGNLDPDFDSSRWAVFLFNSWEGSIIHMKVTRSIDPLIIFDSIIFKNILRGTNR